MLGLGLIMWSAWLPADLGPYCRASTPLAALIPYALWHVFRLGFWTGLLVPGGHGALFGSCSASRYCAWTGGLSARFVTLGFGGNHPHVCLNNMTWLTNWAERLGGFPSRLLRPASSSRRASEGMQTFFTSSSVYSSSNFQPTGYLYLPCWPWHWCSLPCS